MPASEAYTSFTGVFTGDITFDWSPEPIVVADELRSMAGELMQMGPPLEGARDIAAQDIQQRFDTKTDPSGAGWEPWTWSYAQVAEREGGSLLERTGAMRSAAASPSAFEVSVHPGGGEVVFTGAGLPWYWELHQQGTASRTTRWGTPNPLPQRAFVGLSAEAEIAVIDLFDEWVASIVGGIGPAGGGLFRHRTGWVQRRMPSGRWGPRV